MGGNSEHKLLTTKLLPPYDVSTVAQNVWESRGTARQLNVTVRITGVNTEPKKYMPSNLIF
jgi:hypothetical protein